MAADDKLAQLEARGLALRRGAGNLGDLSRPAKVELDQPLTRCLTSCARTASDLHRLVALVKLVVEEPESDALRELLERDADQLASAIIEVEVVRAVRRAAPQLTAQAALHLATALAIGDDLDGFVSYDGRLSAAAESAGLVIVAPR